MSNESYSVSEASRVLGVSIPTLKRMAEEGRIGSYRTPGGHLRISGESLEAFRQGKQARATREPSPVLTNRRERVEELALEAQELRAKREIGKLQAEEEAEVRSREEEAEAEERAAEREAEAQRLRLERVRIQRERQEREREETERLAAWRAQWLEKAMAKFPYWVSPAQRKEAVRTLDSEIGQRGPECERIMERLIQDTIADLIAPWEAERYARQLRERIVRDAQSSLPWSAAQHERTKAEALIRKALSGLPITASEAECRAAAEDSVADLCAAIERRLALEATEKRRAELVKHGVSEVGWYLRTLHNDGEISHEDYHDSELRADLEAAVREALEEEFEGDESEPEVDKRVREIVDDEFEIADRN